MICAKCGVDYSDSVFPHHVSRCPGNTPTKFVVDEPKIEQQKEDNDVQEQEQKEKTQVTRVRRKR
jgi:hypothetical protein